MVARMLVALLGAVAAVAGFLFALLGIVTLPVEQLAYVVVAAGSVAVPVAAALMLRAIWRF
jgi:hypothetical protein